MRASIALAEGFTADQWDLATRCPGWSVKDVYSHLVGVERLAMGEPNPDHDLPDYPWVSGPFGTLMEIHVDIRRTTPGDDVLEELRQIVERRVQDYADPELDGDSTVVFFGSERPLRELLAVRVFDRWAHEQDIRAAIGVPGNLDSIAAAASFERMRLGLSRRVTEAGAVSGDCVVVETTGAGAFRQVFLVADDGSVIDAAQGSTATLLLRTGTANWVSLVCGRADAVLADVQVEGDQALAHRLLPTLAITP